MMQVIKKHRSVLISLLSFVSFFILWEIGIGVLNISQTVLIKPTEIVTTSIDNFDILSEEMLYTAVEIVVGWVVGSTLGFVLAVLIYRNPTFSKSLVNTSVLINSIPLIALTAILGGIIGSNQVQKIVIVSLVTFFPMFITTLFELTSIQQGHKDLLLSYCATPNQILQKILLPKSLPSILNTAKVNIILAIFTAVTAEFFGGYGGIGVFILSKKGLYNLKLVWAGIFFIAIFGTIFYFSAQLIQKRIIKWQRS